MGALPEEKNYFPRKEKKKKINAAKRGAKETGIKLEER